MFAAAGASRSHALVLPASFTDDPLPYTFAAPTDIAFLPDGRMLVAEKGGVVWLVSVSSRQAIWSHESEVLGTLDVGLLGIAVHPDFGTHPWIYLLYTCDPDSGTANEDTGTIGWGRLTRYAFTSPSSSMLDPTSRMVLIGKGWADGWICTEGFHHVDDLVFGEDGSLLVSAGDGADFNGVDAGGQSPQVFLPGRAPSSENIGAFRSQMLESLSGKILRIDPLTGLGYPGNPFYDGDDASNRSRVWTYGHRNPFRFAIRGGTGSSAAEDADPGTLYVGDVGWIRWEEVDVAASAGFNFGWPCYEGRHPTPEYQSVNPPHHGCSTIGTSINPSPATLPILDYHHTNESGGFPPGYTGYVIAGGVFYEGTRYPVEWRGRYFYADAELSWIRALSTTPGNQLIDIRLFAEEGDGPVSFASEPGSGDLCYASVWTGEIHRIRYVNPLGVAGGPERTLALSPAHPNPGGGRIRLSLALPDERHVSFSILDLQGRTVYRAAELSGGPGEVALEWSGRLDSGGSASAGVYVALVRAGSRTLTRRFVVVR